MSILGGLRQIVRRERWPLRVVFAAGGVLLGGLVALLGIALRWLIATDGHASLVDDGSSHFATNVAFATCVSALLGLVGRAIGENFDRLAETAATDPLTVVGNRRAFEERLEIEIDRAARSRMPLALLVIDVDRLKTINDTHGHSAGDAALRLVAETIVRSCRTRDVVARWGGDEFAVLMTRTRAVEAVHVANRIHRALRAAGPLAMAGDMAITVSIGAAEADGELPTFPAALFDAADRALLGAKGRGRDRTCVAEPKNLEDVRGATRSGYHFKVSARAEKAG